MFVGWHKHPGVTFHIFALPLGRLLSGEAIDYYRIIHASHTFLGSTLNITWAISRRVMLQVAFPLQPSWYCLHHWNPHYIAVVCYWECYQRQPPSDTFINDFCSCSRSPSPLHSPSLRCLLDTYSPERELAIVEACMPSVLSWVQPYWTPLG